MKNGLIISNLSFSFTPDHPFFTGVSFALEPGKVHALRGKNGVGKSTLFRLLQGVVHRDELVSGTAQVHGTVYTLSSATERAAYGGLVKTVVQDVRQMIAPEYTVQENIQLAALPKHPGLYGLPIVEFPGKLAEQLYTFYHTPAGNLSGGQRALLALGMIVQHNASVLLLDEPTAALDPINAQLVMEYVQQLARNLNLVVLFISHDEELITTYTTGTTIFITMHANGTREIIQQQ